MKSFTKKLALVLSLAMVVTLVAPAVTAKADAKYTCTYAEQDKKDALTSYTLEKVGDTVDLKVRGLAGDWQKGYTGWKSSNPAVATVDKGTGLVTAVSQGTAEISVGLSSDYAIGTVTVQVGADVTVGLKGAATGTAERSVSEQKLTVGGTVELAFFGVTNYTKNNFTVTWKSADEKVATVDNGLVTAVAEGSTAVSVVVVNNKTGAKFEPAAVTITVKADKKMAAVQTTTYKANVTFEGLNVPTDTEGVKRMCDDVKMVYLIAGKYEIIIPIQNLTYSTTTKTYEVTSYVEFQEGVTYKFTYGDAEASFVGHNGAPAKVVVSFVNANVKNPVAIRDNVYFKATLLDANDIDVTASATGTFTFSIDETSPKYNDATYWSVYDNTQGDGIYFDEEGLAFVKCVYTEDNKEPLTSALFQVEAKKAAEIVVGVNADTFVWSIGTDPTANNKVTKIIIEDAHGLNGSIYSDALYVAVKDNSGLWVSNYPGKTTSTTVPNTFKFTSTDKDYLAIGANDRLTAGNPRNVLPVIVQHEMQDNNNNTITTVVGVANVQIGEKRAVDASKVTVKITDSANNTATSVVLNTDTHFTDSAATVKFTVKDQYNVGMAGKTAVVTTVKSQPKDADGETNLKDYLNGLLAAETTATNGEFSIAIVGSNPDDTKPFITSNAITETFTVEFTIDGSVKKNVTITLKTPNGSVSKREVFGTVGEIDLATKNGAKSLELSLAGYANGVIKEIYELTGETPAKASDMLIGKYYYKITKATSTVSGTNLSVDRKTISYELSSSVDDGVKNVLSKTDKTGTYLLTVSAGVGSGADGTTASGARTIATKSIVVKDTDPALAITYVRRKELKTTSNDFATIVKENFEFKNPNKVTNTFNGIETLAGADYFVVDDPAVSSYRFSGDGKDLYIYTVVVYYRPVANRDLWVKYNVTVNSRVEINQ